MDEKTEACRGEILNAQGIVRKTLKKCTSNADISGGEAGGENSLEKDLMAGLKSQVGENWVFFHLGDVGKF